MRKLKEDIVAMALYIIAALIIGASLFLYFASDAGWNEQMQAISDLLFIFGIIPVLLICVFLVSIGRIIDLLNQINQKLDE